MLVINPAVRVFAIGDLDRPSGFLFNVEGKVKAFPFQEQQEIDDLSALLAGTATPFKSERVRAFIEEHSDLTASLSTETVESFLSNSLSRQISYLSQYGDVARAVHVLERVAGATAVIFGVGGMGCHIAEHLVRMGVRSFVLIDDDHVEPANLNRQILYSHADLGKRKTAAARDRLDYLAGGHTAIQTFPSFAEAVDKLTEQGLTPEVIFVSADTSPFAIRRQVVSYGYRNNVPYAFASYVGTQAIIAPAAFDLSQGCGSCATVAGRPEAWLHDLAAHKFCNAAPSAYSINAIAAALAVELWTRSLMESDGGNLDVQISMRNLEIKSRLIARDPACPICGEQSEK